VQHAHQSPLNYHAPLTGSVQKNHFTLVIQPKLLHNTWYHGLQVSPNCILQCTTRHYAARFSLKRTLPIIITKLWHWFYNKRLIV